MFSSFHGGNGVTDYSASWIENEIFETPADTNLTGNLAWLPVVPGTVNIAVGTNEATDNGAGVLSGTAGTGTIDYNTGAFTITLGSAPASNDEVSANYIYNNMDAPVKVPEVNLKIEAAPIIARSRKLKTLYAFDAALTYTSAA